MSLTVNDRIAKLRALMRKQNIDAYIVPSGDPHQSEYVADSWKYREWISGFDGSAGTAVITADHAGVWTDSRYFLQAEEQLANSEYELHKTGVQGAVDHMTWLTDEIAEEGRIGANPWAHSLSRWKKMEKQCDEWDIELVATPDLIEKIWIDQPPIPAEPVFEHDVKYTGESRQQKFDRIREKMEEEEADLYLITTLDDIAWTFNLRGRDVEFNPVTIAYAIISGSDAKLFIDSRKISVDFLFELENDGVEVIPYDEIVDYLGFLSEDETIWIDPATVSKALYEAISDTYIVESYNIPMRMKAVKNDTEIENIKTALRKDGVALTRFFMWLENELTSRGVTEADAAVKLASFRAEQENYYGESFNAIVGYAGNGAIVHYRPHPETSATIVNEGILLLDSGGQYYEGTTDITRTLALGGQPTPDQKKHYTLVLKGHIALDLAIFPEGTTGIQLDTLARQYLWQHQLDYGHGTGHGVGAFLNVHEPPQGFAPTFGARGKTELEPGMVSSNEPGYYETDSHGIRIENLVLTISAGQNPKTEEEFFSFENLTVFPIDTKLIDGSLITESEKEWLNSYHEKVYRELSPLLSDSEANWLKGKCTKI